MSDPPESSLDSVIHSPDMPQRRASAWPYVVWSVALLAYVIAVTNRSSLSAVGVDTAERFHTDAATLSMFAVVQLAVYGAMQVPIGLLLDRYGSRPIMTIGMVLMAAGQLTIALSDSVGIAILARALIGAGDAAIFPGALRLIATWFPAQRAPMFAQLTGIAGQGGQIVAVVPLTALLHSTTWTIAFGSLAGLAALFAILVFALLRNRPPELESDVSVNTDTGVVRVVRSSIDTGTGARAAWGHPGTRLAFWTHFTTMFSLTAFSLLWGFPFLTAGEGLSTAAAAGMMTILVVVGMVTGPILGDLSRRIPHYRSYGLVLPTILVQIVAWGVTLAWPGPAPMWLLVVLMVALGVGGPASMIAFDHARTHNPAHRLSTATGMANVGGFLAALIAILLIGLALDAQGAGTPDTYTLDAFRVAFLTQIPLWLIGITFIVIERHKVRVRMGLDPPWGRRTS